MVKCSYSELQPRAQKLNILGLDFQWHLGAQQDFQEVPNIFGQVGAQLPLLSTRVRYLTQGVVTFYSSQAGKLGDGQKLPRLPCGCLAVQQVPAPPTPTAQLPGSPCSPLSCPMVLWLSPVLLFHSSPALLSSPPGPSLLRSLSHQDSRFLMTD